MIFSLFLSQLRGSPSTVVACLERETQRERGRESVYWIEKSCNFVCGCWCLSQLELFALLLIWKTLDKNAWKKSSIPITMNPITKALSRTPTPLFCCRTTKLAQNMRWGAFTFHPRSPLFQPARSTQDRGPAVSAPVPAVASDVSSSALSHDSVQGNLERVEVNIEKVILMSMRISDVFVFGGCSFVRFLCLFFLLAGYLWVPVLRHSCRLRFACWFWSLFLQGGSVFIIDLSFFISISILLLLVYMIQWKIYMAIFGNWMPFEWTLGKWKPPTVLQFETALMGECSHINSSLTIRLCPWGVTCNGWI